MIPGLGLVKLFEIRDLCMRYTSVSFAVCLPSSQTNSIFYDVEQLLGSLCISELVKNKMKADKAVEDVGESAKVAGGVTFEWLRQVRSWTDAK